MEVAIPKGTRPTSDDEAIFLDLMLARTATRKDYRVRGHYINLHSKKIRKVSGRRYGDAIRNAVDHGYVDPNGSYKVKGHTKSYRLEKPYRTGEAVPYQLSRKRNIYRIDLKKDDWVGWKLAEQFPKIRLPANPKGWDQYVAWQMEMQHYRAGRCDYGRFHSLCTCLKKEYRKLLETVDGVQLVETDVSNCQPLLIGHMARRWLSSGVFEYGFKNGSKQEPNTQQNQQHTITGRVHIRSDVVQFSDREIYSFIEMCERGELYEYVWNELCGGMTLFDFIPEDKRHRYARDRQLTKDDVKRQMNVMWFDRNEPMQEMEIFKAIQGRWPDVARFVIESKKSDYRNLAHQCQRLESRIMINGVCGEIFRKRPEAILVTIHDSIMTTPDLLGLVQQTIRDEFAKEGVWVHLK